MLNTLLAVFFLLNLNIYTRGEVDKIIDMDKIINKMIFAGSNSTRNIENERHVNFLSPYSQLVYINLKTATAEIITKQTDEKTDEDTEGNIPCLLLSQQKHNLHATQQKTLIIYFGGNGETIYNSRGYEFFNIAKQDSDVLLVGYPGYPGSKTQASPENFYLHTEVLARCLNNSLTKIYKKIIVIGWSLGCAAAINTTLCTNEKIISHIALINGFKNIKECAKHLINNRFPIAKALTEKIINNIKDDFDNESRIQKITAPLTIIYTPQDDIVNNKDSTTLYNAAKKCKDKTLKQIPGNHIKWDSALVYNIIKLHTDNKKSEIDQLIPKSLLPGSNQ